MLPGNVIVQEHAGGVEVSAVDPIASMQAIENPDLAKLATGGPGQAQTGGQRTLGHCLSFPLWVISGHRVTSASCQLFPSKRTFISASGLPGDTWHVWCTISWRHGRTVDHEELAKRRVGEGRGRGRHYMMSLADAGSIDVKHPLVHR